MICQLRFPPILRIAGDPAGFQDRIRDVYPLYDRSQGVELPTEIRNALTGVGVPNIAGDITHKFLTEDQKSQISISKNFVAATTNAYGRWEEFRREIARAVKATAEEFSPTFYDRIGLRYCDAVDREALGLTDTSWTELIRPEFAGPLDSAPVGEAVEAFHAQVRFALTDVPGSQVQVRYGLDDAKGHFLVDADFYLVGRIDGNKIFEALDSFNRSAGNLFRWSIKPNGTYLS